jgi:hypothetical protein
VGKFRFYARAIDSSILTAFSAIAADMAASTQQTMESTKQFLDYAASQNDCVVTYRAFNMILPIHSDASYLSETKARS